jgi:hypothetical protein
MLTGNVTGRSEGFFGSGLNTADSWNSTEWNQWLGHEVYEAEFLLVNGNQSQAQA